MDGMADVQERLDEILAAQSGRSVAFGLTDADYFLVVGLYLSPGDLEAIRPALRDDPDPPRLGVGPRYDGVPVYPAAECPPEGPGCAEYQGVRFRYVPMGHVEG
jgi:hypothetical protein